jgi:hypothetical protein
MSLCRTSQFAAPASPEAQSASATGSAPLVEPLVLGASFSTSRMFDHQAAIAELQGTEREMGLKPIGPGAQKLLEHRQSTGLEAVDAQKAEQAEADRPSSLSISLGKPPGHRRGRKFSAEMVQFLGCPQMNGRFYVSVAEHRRARQPGP